MCLFCGSPLPKGKIMFRDVCPDCGKDIHTCRHCRFYKAGVYRDCAETVPEEVKDKDRNNFCEYFSPVAKVEAGGAKPVDDAKKAFDKLFG